jgi:hypothetical protein
LGFERLLRSLSSFSASLLLPDATYARARFAIRDACRATPRKLDRLLKFCDRLIVHLFLEVRLGEVIMCETKIRIHFDRLAVCSTESSYKCAKTRSSARSALMTSDILPNATGQPSSKTRCLHQPLPEKGESAFPGEDFLVSADESI